MAQFGAALRQRGLRTVRYTGRDRSLRQVVRTNLERSLFERTHAVLRAGSDGQLDVSPILERLPKFADVQSADEIGAQLVLDRRWQQEPRLRRVHATGLNDFDCYDKLSYTTLAAAAGVPVPPTWSNAEEVPSDVALAVKSRVGSGGTGVRLVAGISEAAAAAAEVGRGPKSVLYQQAIAGEVWNVGGVSRDGEILTAAAYRAAAPAGDPHGPPVEIELEDRPDLLDSAGRIVSALGYRGPFALDFVMSDDDTGYLIDFNPRIFGSWPALQAGGVDLLGFYLYSIGLARRPPKSAVQLGRFFRTSPQGDPAIRRSIARARELNRNLGPVLGADWRRLNLAEQLLTARPSWLTGPRPTGSLVLGDDHRVVMAYNESWGAAITFGGALRHRQVDVVRHTVPGISRKQRVRQSLESLCFSASVFDLRETVSGAIDVGSIPALVDHAWDVQMTERVAERVLASPQWRALPELSKTDPAVDEDILIDKALTMSWAQQHGIPVPETYAAVGMSDLAGCYPVVVKHPVGYGGKWVAVCSDAEQVAATLREWDSTFDEVIFQEFIDGPMVNVGGVAEKGRILTAAAYVPTQAADSPTGPPVSVRLVPGEAALESSTRLVETLGLRSIFCFNFVQDAAGVPKLIDVNARVFGSWCGLQTAGVDILGNYLYELGLRQQPSPRSVRLGVDFPVEVLLGEGLWRGLRHNSRLVRQAFSLAGLRGAIAITVNALAQSTNRPPG